MQIDLKEHLFVHSHSSLSQSMLAYKPGFLNRSYLRPTFWCRQR